MRKSLGIDYGGSDALKQAFFGGRMVSVHLRAPTLYRDVLHDRRAFQYWVVNPSYAPPSSRSTARTNS